ncbi:similar to Saccharomyces cerevisiae YLR360W VPS38 Part of a Vps34p phosphatidylinositol 3- kinase complex that functions in carboxypeptidase Y (CPY) sorting [Maudiozyma barnettii]|uniref:Similar to Saccharomyces cerevisiae YLR360W VPS38 Part of a Vps34p phosphatidylinositol 3- kinase complex that functions in carboxypeptidase Y (CPY) sorting n=1 Tax=Maudiozyma barnettii TaxID=61262 RepID=A0A8H2VKJ9_9SACH|nr:Vps38p [Kazachstania barnettii]CAB4257285.1 similar to Saccharomyces cerevisiae YLR360W VPS38 Part of a Vps34p phosphatidylinositol 3- kinase complex that functions in carboxypeptidase Y (CPY) sorting [Kazachstania barnettii]CAD1784550.1 similar to Saccharomyces cerevisiae YLR360W VPS38 Part of a Vps34p phosphatidylinositol 3- kinase complex that functions in carboxypeptidase Y (CPY) sorting [Kazachstania barnettii]
MTVQYLLQRRLRHLRSITINNVALQVDKNINNKEQTYRETIRSIDCFYVIESLKGVSLLVSEIQRSPLKAIQFNDVNFCGDSTTRFIFKIVVHVPDDLFPEHIVDNQWCIVKEYSVDLNHLQLVDRKNDNVQALNAPIFTMDDGCYTLKDINIERGSVPLSMHDNELQNKIFSTTKKSFTYNTVLKLNKLLEYIGQTHDETKKLSSKLEKPLSKTQETNKSKFENIETCKEQINKLITKKRTKIKLLKEEIEGHGTLIRSNTASSVDISDKTNVNDQYGNMYSNLFQTRNNIVHWRTKKLTQLVSIFKVQKFFDLAKQLNCDIYISVANKTNTELLIHRNQQEIVLSVIEKDKLQLQINKSLDIQERVNVFLGYFLLFIDILSNNIFNIVVPYKLMFYGSTSLINKVYPLYLPPAYSAYNQERFYEAIDLFNINIQQLKQYLTDHYNNI